VEHPQRRFPRGQHGEGRFPQRERVALHGRGVRQSGGSAADREGGDAGRTRRERGFAGHLVEDTVSSMAENSDIEKRLRADLTTSMKAKDSLRTATLRMLLSAIGAEKVAGKEARELTDDDVLRVLAKESKKRGESAEIYTQNGRGELAATERAEAQIIDEYLPTPLTDAELADVADTAIAQVAEELGERPGMRQMGQVMKAATAIAAGKADGSRLSAAVRSRL